MQDYQQINIEIANHDEAIERYKKERDELIAKRKAIIASELADAVAKVIALGGHATVEPPKKSGAPRAPTTGPKKYRNPATGEEWSGQGSEAKWILNKDKAEFVNPAWLVTKQGQKYQKAQVSQPTAVSAVLPNENQAGNAASLTLLPVITQAV